MGSKPFLYTAIINSAKRNMLFLLFLLIPLSIFSNSIFKVSNFEELKTFLENVNENDLVIFDVDGTLIIPEDAILCSCGEKFFLKQFAIYSESMSEARMKFLASKILIQRKINLVHQELPLIIKSIQTKSAKIIAFTSLITGRFGSISNMENWRINELQQLDLNFTATFPRYNHIVFGDIRRENSLPIFKDGILFASRHTKGEVLVAFLNRIKFTPKRIIFIDNVLGHLESVQNALEDDPIEKILVHFESSELSKKKLNEEFAEKQFQHLRSTEMWLSDKSF